MKRLIPILIVILAGSLFWFRERWLPAAADHAAYLGYVEGESLLIGPPVAGRIVTISVAKGDRIAAGDLLFQLDDSAARMDSARLSAAVATARALAANLASGKRAEEMDVIVRQEAEAQANVTLAQVEFTRVNKLSRQGIAAETQLDKAKAALAVAEERLKQIQANAVIARLPARAAEIDAAHSRITEAEAALATANAKLADFRSAAPVGGLVDDVFFDPGEVVGAGQPVLALLQPEKATLLFYIPEAERAKAQAGVTIRYRCDGCGDGGTATITHVAATPEYTPPVIYSASARAKLVFQVEARPVTPDAHLQPGLPVEFEPLP